MSGIGLLFRRMAVNGNYREPLPVSDFAYYEKLIGDGSAYIELPYKLNKRDNLLFKYSTISPTTAQMVYGARDFNANGGRNSLYLHNNANQSYLGAYSPAIYEINNANTAETLEIEIVLEETATDTYARRCYKNGERVWQLAGVTWDEAFFTTNFFIFASNTSNSTNIDNRKLKGAIYYFDIVNALTGEIMVALRPCTYKGEPGMVDIMTMTFYGNAGGGSFSVE